MKEFRNPVFDLGVIGVILCVAGVFILNTNQHYRSFDLNFEVNAIVYDEEIAIELAGVFFEDVNEAEKIDLERWNARSKVKQLLERSARLVSPLL